MIPEGRHRQHSDCGGFHRTNDLVTSRNKSQGNFRKRGKKEEKENPIKDLRDQSANLSKWTLFELIQTMLKIIFMKQLHV